MRCEKIKEILATDYLDDRAGEGTRRIVEDHLTHCECCKQYAEELMQTAVEPFRQVREVYPPERVWSGIKEKIQSEQEPVVSPEDSVNFAGWLRAIFTPQRLSLWVPVMAIFLVFVIAHVLNVKKTASEHLAIGTYLVTEINAFGTADSAESDTAGSGFGTVIENYFI